MAANCRFLLMAKLAADGSGKFNLDAGPLARAAC